VFLRALRGLGAGKWDSLQGHPVPIVQSNATNIKLTTKSDLFLAEPVLKSRPEPKGTGPIHPFADEEMWGGRPK
jgi:hypothetical protein